MKIFFISLIFSACFFFNAAIAQNATLTAVYDAGRAVVRLNWNMVKNFEKTGYLLLKSNDGIEWSEVAKDKKLRQYTEEDIYFFIDKNASGNRLYYRLKIFDTYNRTIQLSPVVVVYITTVAAIKNNFPEKNKTVITQPANNSRSNNSQSWVLYPNPVTDVLTLSYKGNEDIKGVVNVQVQDGTGKIVVKFRSASLYKNIKVPVTKLARGIYFVQITVLNEVMMSQQFVKQ